MAGRGLDGEGIGYFRKGSKEDIFKEVAFQLNPERGGREPWEGLEEDGTSSTKRIWDKKELACSRKKKTLNSQAWNIFILKLESLCNNKEYKNLKDNHCYLLHE